MPTEYVDITDEIDLKLEMLECHESQLKWMREHDNIDFADMVIKKRLLYSESREIETFNID